MDSLLYRASGYDFANLWMNMAKIVIALVFLYQNALDTQLGVKLFQDYYYVFHVPVSGAPADEIGVRDVVTPEDPFFSIEFKPLALGQAYDQFTVEVLKLTNQDSEDLLRPASTPDGPCLAADPHCVHFSWDELTGGNKAVLHRASFNLLDLVENGGRLLSGDYDVEFGFNFYLDGRELGESREPDVLSGTLKFLRQEELRFGDIPVVHGRAFAIPRLVLDRLSSGGAWGGWDAYRRVGILQTDSQRGWEDGSVLEADFEEGWLRPARRLRAGRTYEQRGHYLDENGLQVDFTIGFSLLDNAPPRSTYLGPGDSDIHFVRIFYEWHFFEEDQGYYYYNLSRHIIDPDGTTSQLDGRPDVRVRSFARLRPQGLPYRLRKDPATGDWHLQIEGRIEDSLERGASHDLRLIARDDFQEQPIRIRIER